jgi:hypothetical protein
MGVRVDNVPSLWIPKTPIVAEPGLRLNSNLPSELTAMSVLRLLAGSEAETVDAIGVNAPLLAILNPEMFEVTELTP